MKRSKFTEQQIAFALNQAELGTPVEEVCRKIGLSDATYYDWKAKFGGMTVSDAQRLKALETENAKLKQLFAKSMLDNAALKDVVGRKW